MLEGVHFEAARDIVFRELIVRYSYLDEWMNLSGFKINIDDAMEGVVVEYNVPDVVTMEFDGGLKVTLFYSVKFPSLTTPQKKAVVSHRANIGLEPPTPMHFDEYWDLLYQLQNFFTLATTEPVHISGLVGLPEADDEGPPPSAQIFFQLSHVPALKQLHPLQFLFTFSYVEDRLHQILSNMLSKADLLQPVADLYFGTLYNPRMYLEQRFLSYTQAIESYHRRLIRNAELEPEQHELRVRDILESTPEGHRDWLGGKLEYSNEPSLRQRLRDLSAQYSGALDEMLDRRVINDIVTTRNYLTHFDKSLESRALKDRELFELAARLRVLLQLCLLDQLGFRPDEVRAFVPRLSRVAGLRLS